MTQLQNTTRTTLSLSTQDSKLSTQLAELNNAKRELATELQTRDAAAICNELHGHTALLFLQVQHSINFDITLSKSISIAEARRRSGGDLVKKMILVATKYFVNSLQVKNKLAPLDLLEFAMLFEEKYEHESVDDLILALKLAKTSGKKLYQSISSQELFEIMNEYLEKKAEKREDEHRKRKVSSRDFQNTISILPVVKESIEAILNKPTEFKTTKKKNLVDELNELKAYFLQYEVSIADCVAFEKSCIVKGMSTHIDLIREVIELKRSK